MLEIRIVCPWERGWWGIVRLGRARVVLREADVVDLEVVGAREAAGLVLVLEEDAVEEVEEDAVVVVEEEDAVEEVEGKVRVGLDRFVFDDL